MEHTFTETDLERAFRHWRDVGQRERYIPLLGEDPRSVMARWVESEVKSRLMGMGYVVNRTGHNDSFDLMVQGCRIEVKAATWSGERYQANLRGNDAEVLIMGCLYSRLHFFVIPFDLVRGLTYLKITSHDPRGYEGKWMTFYEAWSVVDEMVATARNPWQLPMVGLGL